MTETARKPRTVKSPQQKAQESLEAASARLEKANLALGRAENALQEAKGEFTRAQQIAEYAARHPDLPQPTVTQSISDTWVVASDD